LFNMRGRGMEISQGKSQRCSYVCPHCIHLSQRKRPIARINDIVTKGFGVRGQVDLIDFQSMPDRDFKYLLNYIDHGVKKLTSNPLVFNAYALVTIFTEQGPPSILQRNNDATSSVVVEGGHA
jgi:hypothetical protein